MNNIDLFKEFVSVEGADLKTDSRKVAKQFNKRHAHVMRDIRNLLKGLKDKSFTSANFGFRYEINDLQNGKPNKYCEMSKDGFMLLVMGFTGEAALAIKVKFIEAFNAMASFIQNQYSSLWEKKMMLELKDENSFLRASFGSKLMLQRKQEKPIIQNELDKLDQLLQPNLFIV